jgi:hypothetical protein
MKRPAAKPSKGPRSLISEADREHALDCSPASDPAAMIGPGRREVLDQEDDA